MTIGSAAQIIIDRIMQAKKIKKVTCYLNQYLTVKGTLHGKRDARNKQFTIVVTAGRPNYGERKFLKKAIREQWQMPIFITKETKYLTKR